MVQHMHKIILLHHAHIFLLNKSVLYLKSLYSAALSTCKLGSYVPYSTSYLDLCTKGNSHNIPGTQKNILTPFLTNTK